MIKVLGVLLVVLFCIFAVAAIAMTLFYKTVPALVKRWYGTNAAVVFLCWGLLGAVGPAMGYFWRLLRGRANPAEEADRLYEGFEIRCKKRRMDIQDTIDIIEGFASRAVEVL